MPGTAGKKIAASAEKGSDNKKLLIVLIILLVLLVLTGAIIIAVLLRKSSGGGLQRADQDESNRRTVATSSVREIVNEENASSIFEQMREEVKEGMFECKMTFNWTFKNGKSASEDAYVANSINNTYPIYFDLFLEDPMQMLYSSPVLPVGTDLSNIKLDQELPAGDYKAICRYTLLRDVETQEEISSAEFVVAIKVLK